MNAITLVVAMTVCTIAGAWAHELTHAIAARALGGRIVAVDLWDLHVAYRLDADDPHAEAKQFAVGVAPAIVGLAIGALWLALEGVPDSRLGVATTTGWSVMTFFLSPSDLSPRVGRERFEARHG